MSETWDKTRSLNKLRDRYFSQLKSIADGDVMLSHDSAPERVEQQVLEAGALLKESHLDRLRNKYFGTKHLVSVDLAKYRSIDSFRPVICENSIWAIKGESEVSNVAVDKQDSTAKCPQLSERDYVSKTSRNVFGEDKTQVKHKISSLEQEHSQRSTQQ